jgi:hypothetical protein
MTSRTVTNPINVYIALLNGWLVSASQKNQAKNSSASQENHPRFIEPEGSVPHSQERAICLHPEPDVSMPP